MKQISINVGKDERLEGWENGRFRYLGNSNSIDVGWISERERVRMSNNTARNITCTFDHTDVHLGMSITLDIIPKSYRVLLFKAMRYAIVVTRNNWKTALQITGSVAGILSALRTFGILIHRD